MKLTLLPTLADWRQLLGDRLYVDFVWAWREQEQEQRQKQTRARWANQLPQGTADTWPQPLVARHVVEKTMSEPVPPRVALLYSNQMLVGQKKPVALNADTPQRARRVGT